jgi:hypothetical protein
MVAGGGAKGMGRDWAPFRSSSKRAEMAAWTRAQSYCQKKSPSVFGALSFSAKSGNAS